MTRLVRWWAGLVASIVMVVAALPNKSGTCVDSADAAASSCGTTGSDGMLLVGGGGFRTFPFDAQARLSGSPPIGLRVHAPPTPRASSAA